MKKPLAMLGVSAVVGLGSLAFISGPAQAEVCKTVVTENVARPDSGKHGTWAGDVFTRKVTVCETENGYRATFVDDGTFTTVEGKSPGDGKNLPAGIKGTFKGGATYDFTTNGELVVNDLDPYQAETYPSTAEWVKTWLGGNFKEGNYADGGKAWGWTYSTGCESWLNSGAKTEGDITGKICALKATLVDPTCDDPKATIKATNPNTHVTLAVAFNGDAKTIAKGGTVTYDFTSGKVVVEGRQFREVFEFKAPTNCPTPTTPAATPSTSATSQPGLPVTGDGTGTKIAVGVGALVLGGAAILIFRKRRDTKFAAE